MVLGPNGPRGGCMRVLGAHPEVPSSVLDTVDYPGSREPTKVRRANEREESEQETPSRAAASLKRIPGNHNRPSGQEEVSQVYDRSHAGSSGILLEPKNYCEQRSEGKEESDQR